MSCARRAKGSVKWRLLALILLHASAHTHGRPSPAQTDQVLAGKRLPKQPDASMLVAGRSRPEAASELAIERWRLSLRPHECVAVVHIPQCLNVRRLSPEASPRIGVNLFHCILSEKDRDAQVQCATGHPRTQARHHQQKRTLGKEERWEIEGEGGRPRGRAGERAKGIQR